MKKNTSLALVTSLTLCVCPVFADDEVLDSAAAVREMIQRMDIPQAEKDRFLSQVGAVEKIQTTAIRLDIDAALRAFEQAVAEWSVISEKQGESLRLWGKIQEQVKLELDAGEIAIAEALLAEIQKVKATMPTEEDRAPYDDRVKGWNDTCVALIEEADRDGIDVSEYLLRLLDIRKDVPSHVWQ